MSGAQEIIAALLPWDDSNLNSISGLQNGIKAPGMTTLNSYIGASTNLKTGGLDALMDVTHLPNREPGDADLTSLKYPRVSLNSFLRPPFKAASDTAQRAYIYRLAA